MMNNELLLYAIGIIQKDKEHTVLGCYLQDNVRGFYDV